MSVERGPSGRLSVERRALSVRVLEQDGRKINGGCLFFFGLTSSTPLFFSFSVAFDTRQCMNADPILLLSSSLLFSLLFPFLLFICPSLPFPSRSSFRPSSLIRSYPQLQTSPLKSTLLLDSRSTRSKDHRCRPVRCGSDVGFDFYLCFGGVW